MKILKGLSFSWKKAIGISGVKQSVAIKSGIPTKRAALNGKQEESSLKP